MACQQGQVIAHNLKALALRNDFKPARVNLHGTLLKLGLGQEQEFRFFEPLPKTKCCECKLCPLFASKTLVEDLKGESRSESTDKRIVVAILTRSGQPDHTRSDRDIVVDAILIKSFNV